MLENYFKQLETVYNRKLSHGDIIFIIGETAGVYKDVLEGLRVNDREVEQAEKNDSITFLVKERVRKNDKLYIVKKRLKVQE